MYSDPCLTSGSGRGAWFLLVGFSSHTGPAQWAQQPSQVERGLLLLGWEGKDPSPGSSHTPASSAVWLFWFRMCCGAGAGVADDCPFSASAAVHGGPTGCLTPSSYVWRGGVKSGCPLCLPPGCPKAYRQVGETGRTSRTRYVTRAKRGHRGWGSSLHSGTLNHTCCYIVLLDM